jgi:hypothetical protein
MNDEKFLRLRHLQGASFKVQKRPKGLNSLGKRIKITKGGWSGGGIWPFGQERWQRFRGLSRTWMEEIHRTESQKEAGRMNQ